MNCPICNNLPKVLYSGLSDRFYPEIPGIYNLKQCPNCKLIFIDPQPSEKELFSHYPEYYGVYKTLFKKHDKKFAIIKLVAKAYFKYGKSGPLLKFLLLPFYLKLSHLPFYVENGKLLEVGCGTGNRMLIFKELGWEVRGLEINQKVARVAQNNTGCKIYVSPLEEADLPEDYFDVVYLNNVFEHLKDPNKALQKIKDTLKENGELIIVIPSEDALLFKLFKQDFFPLDVPRYLFTYNKMNISKLFSQHDFRVKKINYSYSLSSLTSSIAFKLNKTVDAFSFFDKIRLLWAIGFFLDPIFNIFEIGDMMTVRAIKMEK